MAVRQLGTKIGPMVVSAPMTKQIPIVGYLALGDEPHLQASECTECGALYFDRRNACGRCGKQGFRTRDLANDGVLISYSIVHQSAPNVPVPFVAGIVELAGGGTLKTNIVNVEPAPEALPLGMKVRLTTFVAGTDDDGTEAIGFGFEPADESKRSGS
jgi:uncharacterized OB-fold protein